MATVRNKLDPQGKGIDKLTAAPGERPQYWDVVVPGLHLRVGQRAKTWFLLTDVHTGKDGRQQSRVALGRWPTMSITQAREAAEKLRAAAQTGVHPVKERKAETDRRRREIIRAEANSFSAVRGRFIRYCKEKGLRDATWKEYERVLTGDDFNSWDDTPLAEIDKAAVREALKPISKRAKVQAVRSFAALRAMFNWAASEDIIDVPPTAYLGRRHLLEREAPRTRVLSDLEIAILWQAFDKLEMHGPALKLCLITGARIGEVLGMQLKELRDIKGKHPEWHIPAARMKAGAGHIVPLSRLAMDVLEHTIPVKGYVFSFGDGPMHYQSKKINEARDLAAKIVKKLADREIEGLDQCFSERWTPHDLRRTFRTRLAELGVNSEIAELLIGHQRRGIEATYNRAAHAIACRRAMTKWDAELRRIILSIPWPEIESA